MLQSFLHLFNSIWIKSTRIKQFTFSFLLNGSELPDVLLYLCMEHTEMFTATNPGTGAL